jgi:hypothetical protein
MGTVPREVIERLVVLYIIERFDKGVFGRVRLQKVAYFALRDAEKKPLSFRAWDHGEFSPEIPTIVEQLASMGYIAACPLDTGEQGNKYLPTSKASLTHHTELLDTYSKTLRKALDDSIQEYGYKPRNELLEIAHEDALYLLADYAQTLVASNLPELVEIPGMSDAEADELALTFDPGFICAARDIVRAFRESPLDFDAVREAKDPL